MPVDNLVTYKGVWALVKLNKKTGRKQARFYCICLVGGVEPVWAVYDLNYKLVRMARGRDEIAKAIPGHSWGRVMAKWSAVDTDNHSPKARRKEHPVDDDAKPAKAAADKALH